MSSEVTVKRVASTHDVDLALHHFGGDGPTLMICHATGFNATTYRPLIELFREEFDVWGLDFRGHGSSTTPRGGEFDWTNFADDLLSCIDTIGVPSVRFFGHSMGGAATLLAERKRPGVIEAAWLFEPIIFPPDFAPRNSMMAAAAVKRRADFASKAEALARFARRPPLSTLRADALLGYVDGGFVDKDGGVTLACAPSSEAATFDHAGIRVDEIAGLAPRAVIAAGLALTDPSPAEFARPAAEALPNCTYVEYDNLGHLGPLQDPTRIARNAISFLR